jgi:lysophospholipase L1-like esterase
MGEAVANPAVPLRPELEKRGLSYLDLGPYFQQRAAAGETLFWEFDGHPNAQGYALIAEVLAAHLQKHAAQ